MELDVKYFYKSKWIKISSAAVVLTTWTNIYPWRKNQLDSILLYNL